MTYETAGTTERRCFSHPFPSVEVHRRSNRRIMRPLTSVTVRLAAGSRLSCWLSEV